MRQEDRNALIAAMQSALRLNMVELAGISTLIFGLLGASSLSETIEVGAVRCRSISSDATGQVELSMSMAGSMRGIDDRPTMLGCATASSGGVICRGAW